MSSKHFFSPMQLKGIASVISYSTTSQLYRVRKLLMTLRCRRERSIEWTYSYRRIWSRRWKDKLKIKRSMEKRSIIQCETRYHFKKIESSPPKKKYPN
jgi:hypothetical protein